MQTNISHSEVHVPPRLMATPSSIGHGGNVDPDGKRFEKEIEKRGIGETAFL
jgi:hypothetical protein